MFACCYQHSFNARWLSFLFLLSVLLTITCFSPYRVFIDVVRIVFKSFVQSSADKTEGGQYNTAKIEEAAYG